MESTGDERQDQYPPPNTTLDAYGSNFRRFVIGAGSVLGLALLGRFFNEQAQSNVPQQVYEHAFVEDDENEPKVGDIYYLRNELEKAGKTDYFKVRVRNKVLATFGAETKVFLVIIEKINDSGEPIPGTQNSCLVSALFKFNY